MVVQVALSTSKDDHQRSLLRIRDGCWWIVSAERWSTLQARQTRWTHKLKVWSSSGVCCFPQDLSGWWTGYLHLYRNCYRVHKYTPSYSSTLLYAVFRSHASTHNNRQNCNPEGYSEHFRFSGSHSFLSTWCEICEADKRDSEENLWVACTTALSSLAQLIAFGENFSAALIQKCMEVVSSSMPKMGHRAHKSYANVLAFAKLVR